MPEGDAFIRVRNIRKSFAGVHALDDVSLAIGRGEIHCLAGENGSGKSTLIKIMAGALAPDEGEIVIDGRVHRRLRPIEAVQAGIQIIYQDFSLFPNLSVAENIALSAELAAGRRFVDWRGVRRIAREAVARLGVDLDLDARVADLPVADKQLVAIARALRDEARLIVMDEPTTALTEREVRSLLAIIRRLQADGISVLFVSHKLKEVFEVSETIAILRNGRLVAEGPTDSFDWAKLAYHMTGRRLSESEAPAVRREPPTGELLRLEGLGKRGHFRDISFILGRGEILGITGLLGSGRTALAQALFGIIPSDAGRIVLEGRPVRIRSVDDAVALGIGYVPEDRLTEGLFLEQSIGRNIAVSGLDRLAGPLGFVDRSRERELTARWIDELGIATPSPYLKVQSLSGGNQQRVVLARWLATKPRLLILNGPTVGVDVGSKADIHALITDLAAQGMGVLVISDDIPELLHTCGRILLMRRGEIVERFEPDRVTHDELARRLAR